LTHHPDICFSGTCHIWFGISQTILPQPFCLLRVDRLDSVPNKAGTQAIQGRTHFNGTDAILRHIREERKWFKHISIYYTDLSSVERLMDKERSISIKGVSLIQQSRTVAWNTVLASIAQEINIPRHDIVQWREDMKIASLGIDSLMAVAILSVLRKAVRTELPFSIFELLTKLTFGDLHAYLDRH
jgi:hypothetical protein